MSSDEAPILISYIPFSAIHWFFPVQKEARSIELTVNSIVSLSPGFNNWVLAYFLSS